jgi:transcriptional regulator GlxA family with amidase domain
MTTVAITAPTGCPSINTAGLMDALRKTDRAWRMTRDPDAETIFDIRLVGLDDRPIACQDGVVLHPHVAAAQLDPPDLVVVPGLDDDLEPSFMRNRIWVPWIAKWHAAGVRVATSCTGAFLAADAGVLDGKQATTHWIAADAFRRRFPRVLLTPERMLVDAGDVISSGGATTFLTLVIYLTERYGSHDRAVLASKVMLVDGERRSQLPYVAFGPSRDHGDQLIHEVQSFMEANLAAGASVEELAAYVSVSTRTLNRRSAATSSRSVSRRPSGCWKPPPTPSTTSAPESATATRRRSVARSLRPPGWAPDSTGRSTAHNDMTPNPMAMALNWR